MRRASVEDMFLTKSYKKVTLAQRRQDDGRNKLRLRASVELLAKRRSYLSTYEKKRMIPQQKRIKDAVADAMPHSHTVFCVLSGQDADSENSEEESDPLQSKISRRIIKKKGFSFLFTLRFPLIFRFARYFLEWKSISSFKHIY
eukprot:GILJ01012903.1.p1 GENE.GILJ01012903.1~~GILJ01012903.1.p1  ORF type:complete len:144 (-),score=10.72 GILJ01012903.1:190-621(-)